MTEEQAKNWAKDKKNQQRVIDDILAAPTKVAPFAIFMAGIPGAGKTELVQFFKERSLKKAVVIEHDRLVEYIDGYSPEEYYVFRKAGSVLVTRLFEECLKRGLEFIFDGTLSHGNAKRNIEMCLREGVGVTVIYVHQDAQSAWQLTQDRELVKKRSIEKEGFIETCKTINKNLLDIFRTYKENDLFAFWIIRKHGAPGMENSELVTYEHGASIGNPAEIEAILAEEYNIERIKD
jgi:hypothetical protein